MQKQYKKLLINKDQQGVVQHYSENYKLIKFNGGRRFPLALKQRYPHR